MISDPTKRFSSRVENYIRFRPGLSPRRPRRAAGRRRVGAGFDRGGHRLGDRHFQRGFPEKRQRGERRRTERRDAPSRPNVCWPRIPVFTSVKGTAEATTLADGSVDLITAAQAFHWFDRARTRAEFERILKPGGWVALIWNDRQLDSTPFLREYEALLHEFGTDYLGRPPPGSRRSTTSARSSESDDVQQTVVESSQSFRPRRAGRPPVVFVVRARGRPPAPRTDARRVPRHLSSGTRRTGRWKSATTRGFSPPGSPDVDRAFSESVRARYELTYSAE